LNTFHIFSEYAERIKNMQKEIFAFNNACKYCSFKVPMGLERDSISKKSNRRLNTGVFKKIYSAYMEYTHNGEKRRKLSTSQLIMV
jgi:hypothetical protein